MTKKISNRNSACSSTRHHLRTSIMMAALAITLQMAARAERFALKSPPPLPEMVRAELRTVGMAVFNPEIPFQCDSGSRRSGHPSDGAASARATMYEIALEQMSHPYTGPWEAAATIALTPVAAAIGALKESAKRLPTNDAMECQQEVKRAGARLQVAPILRDAFFKAADGHIYYPTRLQPVASSPENGYNRGAASIDTRLDLRVEAVSLRRVPSAGDAFALVIDVRSQLIRTKDGTILYDGPFQFQSGTALLIDWAADDASALQAVTRTGCRYLAEKIVEQLFVAKAPGRVAENSKERTMREKISSARSALSALPTRAGVIQITSPPLAHRWPHHLGRIGIITTSTPPNLSLQRPLTKEKALQQARNNVESWVEEFAYIPFVNLAAFGAAVPLSLGSQSVAALRGLTEAKFESANRSVAACASELNLQQLLSSTLLRQVQAATPYPIVLVEKPFPAGQEGEFSQMSSVMAGTLAWVPDGQNAIEYLASQGIDSVIELQFVHSALNGKGAINPSMALSSEVRCRLMRVREREELYSCMLKYRGREKQFADWAADNAQPLRTELQHFADVVAATVVDQLSLRSIREENVRPTLARQETTAGSAFLPPDDRHAAPSPR